MSAGRVMRVLPKPTEVSAIGAWRKGLWRCAHLGPAKKGYGGNAQSVLAARVMKVCALTACRKGLWRCAHPGPAGNGLAKASYGGPAKKDYGNVRVRGLSKKVMEVLP